MPVTVQASRARTFGQSARPRSRQAEARFRAGGATGPSGRAVGALALQRSAGNAALQRLLNASPAAMPLAVADVGRLNVQRDAAPADQMPKGTVDDTSEQPDIAKEPEVPDASADPALAPPAVRLRAVIDAEIDRNSSVVGVGPSGYKMLNPIAFAYTKSIEAIQHVGNFVTSLATNGARAAVNFATNTILGLAATAGPLGWFLGAATKIVEHFTKFEEKAADFIVRGLLAKVNEIIGYALALTANAFVYMHIKAVQLLKKGEAAVLGVANSISPVVTKIYSAVADNPATQYVMSAVRQILNVWNAVLNSVPAPLRKFLPTPPAVPLPDLGLPGGGASS